MVTVAMVFRSRMGLDKEKETKRMDGSVMNLAGCLKQRTDEQKDEGGGERATVRRPQAVSHSAKAKGGRLAVSGKRWG